MEIVKDTELHLFGLHNPFHESVEVLSFDIWNTLLTRNAEFSRLRNEFLRNFLLAPNYHTDHGAHIVNTAVKTANLLVDAIQETQGVQIGPEARIHVIVDQLNLLLDLDKVGPEAAQQIDANYNVDAIVECINVIFMHNLPTLINIKVIDTINFYRSLLPVAFVSNTGLISGAVMRKALPLLGLEADHYVFSDEIGEAKPRPSMFAPLLAIPGVTKEANIVHIGDNLIADVQGAQAVGITPLYFLIQNQGYLKPLDGNVAWQNPDGPVSIQNLSWLEDVIRASSACFTSAKPRPPYDQI